MTEKTERVIHRISEKYGVSSDGDRNILLMEYYPTRSGKGASAELTGEYAWRPANGGSYYSNIDSLAYDLMSRNVVGAVGEIGLDLDKFKEYIDAMLAEYKSFFKEQITLELAKIKDLSKKEEA